MENANAVPSYSDGVMINLYKQTAKYFEVSHKQTVQFIYVR